MNQNQSCALLVGVVFYDRYWYPRELASSIAWQMLPDEPFPCLNTATVYHLQPLLLPAKESKNSLQCEMRRLSSSESLRNTTPSQPIFQGAQRTQLVQDGTSSGGPLIAVVLELCNFVSSHQYFTKCPNIIIIYTSNISTSTLLYICIKDAGKMASPLNPDDAPR